MFNVDVALSLLFAILAYSVALLFIGVLFHKYRKEYRSLRYFVVFYILIIIGTVLLLFENAPRIVSITIPNALIIIGTFCVLSGYKELYNRTIKKIQITVGVTVYVLLNVIFTFLVDDVTLRIFVYSTYMAGVNAYLAYYLYEESKEQNMYLSLSITLHSLFAAIQVGRMLSVIFVQDVSHEAYMWIESLVIVLTGFTALLIVASIHSVLMEKLRLQLTVAKKEVDRFAEIYHSAPIATLFGNQKGKITHFNEALSILTGLSREELLKKNWTDGFINDDDQIEVMKYVQRALNGEKNLTFETKLKLRNQLKYIQIKISGLEVAGEIFFVAFINDITTLKKTTTLAEELEIEKARILDNIPGFAYRCKNDEEWSMELLSENFVNVTGYPVEALIANRDIAYNELILPEFREQVHYDWARTIEEEGLYEGEYQIRCADGRILWVWERGKPIFKGNRLEYLEGFITDITYKKEVEDKLEFLSYHDSLTGLYNRRFVEAELARIDVGRNLPLSFLKLDIDGLKFANDVFGHRYGDQLIQKVAEVLKETLRSDEIIGRMGGDEFLVLLPSTNAKNAVLVKDRLLARFGQVKMQTEVSVSIGAATKESVEEKTEDLLIVAEENMYSDKMFKKPMVKSNSVRSLLKILFSRFPKEKEQVEKATKLAIGLGKQLNLSVLRLEKLKRAIELHRIGMISDHHVPTDCEYKTESAYRIVKAIPDYYDEANIIMNVCEHYDGNGHPRGVTSNAIPVESQICAFSMVMCLKNFESMNESELSKLFGDIGGKWIDPMIIDTYKRMTK